MAMYGTNYGLVWLSLANKSVNLSVTYFLGGCRLVVHAFRQDHEDGHGQVDEMPGAIAPGISTITFYSTTKSTHAERNAYIQQRVDAIVQANPWIAGRLTSGWFYSNITLEFSREPPQIVVEDANLPNLSPQLDYAQIVDMIETFNVATGTTLINSNHPMLRVVWITMSDTQGALFFSCGHGIADGYTYYRLYGMLSAKTAIEALSPTRVPDFTKKADAVVKGGNDVVPLFSSLPFLANMASAVAFTPNPRFTVHTFNSEWIADEKAKYKDASPVGYVSTNDVLTSWALRTTGCDIGIMAINFRGRVEGVGRHLAGNYESAVGYQPEDYATPDLVRASLATNGYRRVKSGDYPSMWTNSSAFISSWATLYEPAELPGWSMIEHLPCSSGKTPFTATIVLFQRTPTSIGLMMGSRVPLNLDGGAPALIPLANKQQTQQ
ncbi:unnamed protein product [Aphanomyces euteiches]